MLLLGLNVIRIVYLFYQFSFVMKITDLLLTGLLLLGTMSCTRTENNSAQGKLTVPISDNISNQHVSSFIEDEKGYVWIGTKRGLNRYNGYDYRQYFNIEGDSTSIYSDNIQTLFRDSRNTFWIGTDKGVNIYAGNDTFKNILTPNSLFGVIQIIEDRQGNIYANMGTFVSIYRLQTASFERILDFEDHNSYNRCFIDSENRFWLVGRFTVKCYDVHSFALIKELRMDAPINLYHSYLADNGMLWIAHGNFLFKLNTRTLEFEKTPDSLKKLESSIITLIYPYDDNSLLFKTYRDGLYLYSIDKDSLIYNSDPKFPFQATRFDITSLFKDSSSNFWIGSHDQGFTVQYKYSQQFNRNNALKGLVNNSSIISLSKDKVGNLWMSSYDDKLIIYNTKTGNANHINLKTFFPESPFFQDKVKRIRTLDDGTVWLQTDAKILQCRYENRTLKRIKTYFFSEYLNDVVIDDSDAVWVAGTTQNLYVLPKNKDKFDTIPLFKEGNNYKSALLYSSSNKIVLSASNQNLKIIDPTDYSVSDVPIDVKQTSHSFIPTTMYEDKTGTIWLGTNGDGVFSCTKEMSLLKPVKGISNKNISSIIEDAEGNLWIGTLYGLSKYDKENNQFYTYYAYDGIGGNQFNPRTVEELSEYGLIFGGTHGLTVFNPIKITIKREIPLYIEDVKERGNSIIFSTNGTPVANEAPASIEFKHNENDISISYAALDYSEYPRVKYYYMLKGFDPHWIDARNNRQANYSNLPPGDYCFVVKITGNDDTIIESENSLKIHIAQSPWLSPIAICVYVLLVLAFVIYINMLYLRIKANKTKALIAEQEKEQETRINKMNMSFFSNISHEFRTPLTMISGPISLLHSDMSIMGHHKHLLSIVYRSVNRMLRLVNQMMDFNKLENDALKLKVKKCDIIYELNSIIEIFKINAKEKGITLNSYGLEDTFFLLLDKDKLEKIIENLLSNALKYTPQGGHINISFDVISQQHAATIFPLTPDDASKQYVIITIEDDGIGIPDSQLENIFLKYYQVEMGTSIGGNNWGTGIGLYFAKRLVEMHHGFIKAQPKTSPGSLFTLILPADKNVYAPEEIYKESKEDQLQQIHIGESPEETVVSDDAEKPLILIVDDDTEISSYLRSILTPYYQIINKYDAQSACVMLESESPDLIISDVVMSGMSGYEFCEKIKGDISFCHIPVILLTAKNLMEEQIEGLEQGANAYITKPFEPKYLLAVIKSQLKNRDLMRNLLNVSTQAEQVEQSLSPYDKTFMEELYALMSKELSNSEVNITHIAEEMKISRTKLYYKIKGLTGENPNIFFKKYKLNRAAELILSGNYNISEIADMTGFSTASHFSSSFKKQFGISPSEYK